MSGRWVGLCAIAEVVGSGHTVCEVEGRYIAVYHVAGSFYAITDECTHDGGSLDDAAVEGLEVICPRHGARFCLRTGAALSPPAYAPVATYPIRVSGDRLEVALG